MELDAILAYMSLSGYDFRLFQIVKNRLFELIPQLNGTGKKHVKEMLWKIRNNYFSLDIADECDVLFDWGVCLFMMEYYEDAANVFEESLSLENATPSVLFNLALCYSETGEMDRALDYAQKALHLDEAYNAARELLAWIQSEHEHVGE